MSFSEWSNEKKKKKATSFSDWSNEKYGVTTTNKRDDDIAPVKTTTSASRKDDSLEEKLNKATELYDRYKQKKEQIELSKKYSGRNGWQYNTEKEDRERLSVAETEYNNYLKEIGYTSLDELKKAYKSTQPTDGRTWFQAGATKDGVTVGNVAKGVSATKQDVGTNFWGGILNIGEAIVDAGAMIGSAFTKGHLISEKYNQAAFLDFVDKANLGTFTTSAEEAIEKSNKKYDKTIAETEQGTSEFVKKDLYDGVEIAKKIISDPYEKITGINVEENSFLGEKSDELVQSGGQMAAQIGVSFIPVVGQAAATTMMAGTAFGTEAENALNNGATFDEAFTSATISAAAEVLTEKIGGVKFGGKTLTDVAAQSLSKKFTGKVATSLIKAGKLAADATAEGVEEVLSGYMSAIGQKMTYMEDKEIEELFSSEEAMDSFIGGFVLGGTFGSVEAVAQGKGYVTGMTKNEQKVFDKVYNDAIAEAEKDGKTLTSKEKTDIYNNILENMEHGEISIDTIEEVLGGEDYAEYKKYVDMSEGLTNELNELGNKTTPTLADQYKYPNLQKRLDDINAKGKEARTKLNKKMLGVLGNDRLVESYNEVAKRKESFSVDLTQYEGKRKEAVERAIKSGVLNNTRMSHMLVDVLSTIEADKGITFDYTNNNRLKESGFAIQGKTVNGFVKDGRVTLNVNSAKSWQSVVGHEISHVLEGTDAYTELQNVLFEVAKSKGELDSRRAELTELYKDMDADIDAELTADLVGDYIFSNKDFINKLAGNKKTFRAVYNEIKYLCKVATGKELTQMEKVRQEFDKVWKELSDKGIDTVVENAKGNGKNNYSLSGINKDGIEVYETSEETMALTWEERKAKYLDVMKNEYRGRTAKFVRNGHTYYAEFDQRSINKHIYGDKRSSKDGLKALTKAGADGDVFDLVENSQYDGSKTNEKNNTKADYFDYFVKTVQIDGKVFDLIADVEKNYGVDGGYVYTLALRDNKKIKASPADGTSQSEPLKNAGNAFSDDIIPQNSEKSIGNTKFSVSEDTQKTDSVYLKMAKNGNTEIAQRMVDEAAKKAGYGIKAYHGTGYDFTIFDKARQGDNYQDWGRLGKGFYFAPTSREAETWAELSKGAKNKVMPVYLRSENMIDSFEALPDNLKDTIPENWDSLTRRLAEKYAYNYIEYMQEFGYNVQEILIEKGYDGINGHTEFVVFDPEQVKSADAITYDDKGNVIPLSQRFNTANEDIRFSLSKDSQGRELSTDFGTPLKDLALDQDIAPVANVPERVTVPKSAQIANGTRSDELLYESLDNYPMQTIEQKVAEKLRAVEAELEDNRALRAEAETNYNKQIAKLQEQYNAKKKKDTKTAYQILQSISRLERLKASNEANFAKRISDLEARAEKMKSPKYTRAMQKQAKMQEHADFAANLLGDTSTWVDKKLGLQYATNTERRNLRDIVRDEAGNADIARADAIDDALNGQYNQEEAAKKRELAKARGKYAELKITNAEDAYIQMLGEFRHNPETTLTENAVKEFYEKHKNKIDTAKVDKVIEMARQDYDQWIQRVNAELKKQGMREIPYRQGYFPHFTEPKQNFIQKLLNWKTQDNEIPTSIAGLTETFKPTKSWQSFDKTRHSDTTDYSFTKGFDTYSQGVLDWIYHLDTLQKRRAVENHIRFTHSDEGIRARIKEVYANEELDANEAQAQIEKILEEAKNPLNNFVQDFTTHTNILAGKKNSLDRVVEQETNRNIYSVMTNVQNRLSANMVLANVRSALTNFIPITQSWAQVSPMRSLQATKDTIANAIKDDGLIDKSTFLTNRLREVDNLHNTAWDKVLDKAGIMFEVIDNFSSQVIWRSKYNQNLANGMSESQAIKNADQFAENVMAGRSKGNEPTLFNAKNPFIKAFTAFQLEVNNQYGYFFKDVPNDLKAETNHWKLNLAKGYTTAFIGAYVYNALLKEITGSDAALDPIGIIEDLLRDLGLFDDDEEKEASEVVGNLTKNVVEELPFVGGLFGGGRIPITSAIPYKDEGFVGGIEAFAEDAGKTVDAIGKFFKGDLEGADWSGAKNIGNELLNPLLNIGLPVGGNQIKKTYQGLSMFSDEHPVTGSYTDSGNLRFPVEDTLGNRIQAGIFGQYASENAREYFDNGYAPLKEKQIQEYIDVDMPIKDYWEYREGLTKQEKLEDKLDYISGLDLPVSKKNILANNVTDRKEPIDLTNYDDFSSLDEFDYATKNPDKYAFAKSVGGYDAYKTYSGELYDIKADKDSNGKSISGSRKAKVVDYINNLDADYYTKIILYKSEYPSDDSYNAEIINYINNRTDLTYEERVAIYTELGFRVSNGYVYPN